MVESDEALFMMTSLMLIAAGHDGVNNEGGFLCCVGVRKIKSNIDLKSTIYYGR